MVLSSLAAFHINDYDPCVSKRRDMGSKYFGRAIKKWRLIAVLSQEDLAQRADISVATLGSVEREQVNLSEESLCKLCLGLESELGSPMLATVFQDGVEALWKDLLSREADLRQGRGLEAAGYDYASVSPEELSLAFDVASAEVKKLTLLCFRAFNTARLGDLPLGRHSGEALRKEIRHGPSRTRVRKKR